MSPKNQDLPDSSKKIIVKNRPISGRSVRSKAQDGPESNGSQPATAPTLAATPAPDAPSPPATRPTPAPPPASQPATSPPGAATPAPAPRPTQRPTPAPV